MSWDIILFNSSQKINSIEEIDEQAFIQTDFDSIISEYFGSKEGEKIKEIDSSIDFYTDDAPVSNKMISLYSEKALFEIAKLAKIQNWQIYDTSLSKMLDLENASQNGFANFQNYLQKVLNNK